MFKKITLSAEEKLIGKAREKGQEEHSTSDARFRISQRQYVNRDLRVSDFDRLMDELSYTRPMGKFSRDELKEI